MKIIYTDESVDFTHLFVHRDAERCKQESQKKKIPGVPAASMFFCSSWLFHIQRWSELLQGGNFLLFSRSGLTQVNDSLPKSIRKLPTNICIALTIQKFFGYRYRPIDHDSMSDLGGGLQIVNRVKRLNASSNRKGE